MEMKIDVNILLAERNKRAWTQTHLAEVCDLSLRTIQRIEKTGKASHESIKALAAVFECSIENLIYKRQTNTEVNKENPNAKGKLLAILGLVCILIIPIISLFATIAGTTVWVSSISESGLKELHGSSFPLMILLNYTKLALLTVLPGILLIVVSKYLYHYPKTWVNKIMIFAILLLSFANPIIAVITAFLLLMLSVVVKFQNPQIQRYFN